MFRLLWTRKAIGIASFLVLLGAAAMFSGGVHSSEPVTSAELGPQWKCSRTAFVLTTCTQTEGVVPTTVGIRK